MEGAEENAREKLIRKGLDAIVLNTLSRDFHPMGSDENAVIVYTRDGGITTFARESKARIAEQLVDYLFFGGKQ